MKNLLCKLLCASVTAAVLTISANAQMPNILRHGRFGPEFYEQSSGDNARTQNSFQGSHTNNAPCIQWQKCIGGSRDEYIQIIIKLRDGNYLSCGATSSHSGDFHAVHGKYDAFLMKTNGSGNIIWKKTYGGSGDDAFLNIVETGNGDFYAVGSTASNDGQVSGNHGGSVYGDVWLVKTNSNGKLLSQYCYGGSGDEYAMGLTMTKQGRIVFAAVTNSNDGDVSNNHGDYDGWVVKLKPSGAIDFSTAIGEVADDELYTVAEIKGDLLATGLTSTKNADDPDAFKYYDATGARLDQSGNIIYYRKYGGTGSDNCANMAALPDGNAVLTGFTDSHDGDVPGNNGFNGWVWKIDVAHNGNIIWQNFIGVPKDTAGFWNLTQTHDGGFVLAGVIAPNVADPIYTWDAYAAKVNAHGYTVWTKRFGGSNYDVLYGLVEENDGSILMAGATTSNDGDVSGNHGGDEDAWLINLGKCDDHLSAMSADDVAAKNITPGDKAGKIVLSNFPNPFSNSTAISFSVPETGKVSISIFDMNGRLIKTLANTEMQAGIHQLVWNAKDEKGSAVGAGIYFLKMQVGNYVETKKIVVVK